jgi:Bacterial SH3 domain
MSTLDIADVRPGRMSFAEGGLHVRAELSAPPLAPDGTTAAGDVLLHEDAVRPAIGGEEPIQPAEPGDRSETFGSRGKLIAGTAVIAALGVAGLAYFFLASPGAQAPGETAESPATSVQSSLETPAQAAPDNAAGSSSPGGAVWPSATSVQPAPAAPEPSRAASGAALPEAPAAPIVAAAPQAAPAAAPPPTPSAAQSQDDVVFLQRPGVNIRSAPSLNAPVVGTAPTGTQFTATSRQGDWVQVESTRWKGWISSQFLGANKPL